MRVRLVESSGPVSPRFRFSRELSVGEDGALHLEARRGHEAVTASGVLAPARLDALAVACAAASGAGALRDWVGARRGRVGVALCRVEVEEGGELRVAEYLASDLTRDEAAPLRALVELLRAIGVEHGEPP